MLKILQNDPLVAKFGFGTTGKNLPKDTYIHPNPNLSLTYIEVALRLAGI